MVITNGVQNQKENTKQKQSIHKPKKKGVVGEMVYILLNNLCDFRYNRIYRRKLDKSPILKNKYKYLILINYIK